jgi:capsular exopolysaccharide synthesis family protein
VVDSRSRNIERDLIVHLKPKDPVAEAYRIIRSSILFSSTEEHPLHCIGVTSPGSQEGKSTTVCNLAVSIAYNYKRVLLVDADMRKSRLHQVFKKKNKIGLSSFLSGQDDFNSIIQSTDIENLFFIAAGPHPPNPSELLASHKLKEFITEAKKQFDYIIFDTPPIAVVTDASILSQKVDGIVIVVEVGKTIKRALFRVESLLTGSNARIVGTVLNKASAKSSSYHYYYSYYGKNEGS